jgi:hypothetical protein
MQGTKSEERKGAPATNSTDDNKAATSKHDPMSNDGSSKDAVAQAPREKTADTADLAMKGEPAKRNQPCYARFFCSPCCRPNENKLTQEECEELLGNGDYQGVQKENFERDLVKCLMAYYHGCTQLAESSSQTWRDWFAEICKDAATVAAKATGGAVLGGLLAGVVFMDEKKALLIGAGSGLAAGLCALWETKNEQIARLNARAFLTLVDDLRSDDLQVTEARVKNRMQNIATKLYNRFQYAILQLQNSSDGISELAAFFSTAIATQLPEDPRCHEMRVTFRPMTEKNMASSAVLMAGMAVDMVTGAAADMAKGAVMSVGTAAIAAAEAVGSLGSAFLSSQPSTTGAAAADKHLSIVPITITDIVSVDTVATRSATGKSSSNSSSEKKALQLKPTTVRVVDNRPHVVYSMMDPNDRENIAVDCAIPLDSNNPLYKSWFRNKQLKTIHNTTWTIPGILLRSPALYDSTIYIPGMKIARGEDPRLEKYPIQCCDTRPMHYIPAPRRIVDEVWKEIWKLRDLKLPPPPRRDNNNSVPADENAKSVTPPAAPASSTCVLM